MEGEEEVVPEREEGDTGKVGGGGSKEGAERGGEGGEGEGGDRHVEVQRGESNVSTPLAQSMLGLWRRSQGNPSTSWK